MTHLKEQALYNAANVPIKVGMHELFHVKYSAYIRVKQYNLLTNFLVISDLMCLYSHHKSLQ